jgi:electron transport complex protein RnfC
MVHTFTGGVHPLDHKERTRELAIEPLLPAGTLAVPVSQHIGAPARPIVAKGDTVGRGQKIGEPQAAVSAAIHAPTSGKVVRLGPVNDQFGRQVNAVHIEPDGEDAWAEGCNIDRDPEALEPRELVEIIRDAGIVGMGGATFPTHIKLSPPPGKPIDAVILNGVECEPFLTADHRLMLEQPELILAGFRIIRRVLGAKIAVVGIEANKPDAVAVMKRHTRGGDIEVISLPVKYPQGAEKQLIEAALGREVPSGGLPMDCGVVVQNVATAHAIWQAVARGIPLIERVVTVTGDAVGRPGNFLARVGTPFAQLMAGARISAGANKLILGGPMMGLAQHTSDQVVTKGCGGILILRHAEAFDGGPCIRCGRCVEGCPTGLVPSALSICAENLKFGEAETLNVNDCIECGVCTFLCPARRPIVHYIRFLKDELRRRARLAAEKERQQALAEKAGEKREGEKVGT